MLVTKEDVEFIAKKTNLSNRKAKLLTEEERDLSLVLDELSDNLITKEELNKLSFATIIKYIIFRYSKDSNPRISLNEKTYVCSLIEKNFPLISRSKIIKSIPKDKQCAEFAEYCFVLVGFFSHRLKAGEYKNYKNYLIYFKVNSDWPEIYDNLDDWLSIFHQMKTQEFFN